jgi:hypothetical protein
MAAEPLLLNLDEAEFTRLFNAADRGDQAARDSILGMWDEYADREVLCFLCDSMDCQPIYAQILPERNDYQLIAAAICLRCRELPAMLRWSRGLRTLKKMWSKNAKRSYFTLTDRSITRDDRRRRPGRPGAVLHAGQPGLDLVTGLLGYHP